MLQATGSHAGRTVPVGGLGRLLARRGLRAHRALHEAAYDRIADALAATLDPRVLRDLGVA